MTIAEKSLQQAREKAAPEPRSARDYVYLLLLLALLPLVIHGYAHRPDAGARLERTLADGSEEIREGLLELKARAGIEGPLPDFVLPHLSGRFYETLPRHRIEGAMLARDGAGHWGLGMLAAASFFAIIVALFPRGAARPSHLLGAALFTGTAGVMLLFAIQGLAGATRGVIPGGGLGSLPIWLLKIIAGSYDAALDPRTNFVVSAFGFTVSAGFLEEGVKAIPLIWHFRRYGTLGWRGACIWGLASGVGLGVTEGIHYSADFYNGIQPAGIYLVRFLSCIALHALWSGSVGIIIYQQKKQIDGVSRWYGYINVTFSVVVLSMVLHGFYDTFLKKGMITLALLVALGTFIIFALQIEHMRKREAGVARHTAAVH